MYTWYKFFTYLLYPFAPIYLFFRTIKKKEDNIRFKEKLSKIDIQRGEGFVVWLHVASVGEAMSILPLIDNFLKDNKINKILITTITLSSGKILEKKYNKNLNVIHQYLPLDIPVLVNKFLEHWQPNLSIFIDSEIWPNLIFKIKEKNIPLALVNARITKKSFLRWKFFLNFAKKVFGNFDLCLASNTESENFLKILGAKNIKNYGNIKFSSTKNDKNKKFDTSLLNKIKNRKVWCASSTHPDEEFICANTHLKIKEEFADALTIIIPRHINRVNKIREELSKLNLKIILSSHLDQLDLNTDIILVDSYGETLKFFDISKCVFLGKSLEKSLIKVSGQNPIEAAKLGCKIFHGPYVYNFAETYLFFKELGIAKEVRDSNTLGISLVEEFKQDRPKNNEIILKIENYGQDILNKVINELKNIYK